jgi:hypothetical protein
VYTKVVKSLKGCEVDSFQNVFYGLAATNIQNKKSLY